MNNPYEKRNLILFIWPGPTEREIGAKTKIRQKRATPRGKRRRGGWLKKKKTSNASPEVLIYVISRVRYKKI